MTVEQQKQAAAQGAFLEGCAGDWFFPDAPPHTLLRGKGIPGSDLFAGQTDTLFHRPLDAHAAGSGTRTFCSGNRLRHSLGAVAHRRYADDDFSYEEIRKMTVENPAKLIGMD